MKKTQSGFTLIELLIALLLVVVLLVSVQRYMAGVAVDAQDISAQRDQATQARIVLSNIQRDVAQAGYFPYATSDLDLNETVGVSTTGTTLTVASYQPAQTARDCRNSEQFSDGQSLKEKGWIRVENLYFVDDKTLSCNANGSQKSAPFLNNVVDISFTQGVSLLHVCLVIAGSTSTTTCNGIGTVNGYKFEVDMPILSATFKAGQ